MFLDTALGKIFIALKKNSKCSELVFPRLFLVKHSLEQKIINTSFS